MAGASVDMCFPLRMREEPPQRKAFTGCHRESNHRGTDRRSRAVRAPEETRMNLDRTAIVNFSGQFIVSLAGFAATFFIAVLGGSSTLGSYTIAVSLGAFLLIVPAQAIGSGVRKRMSEGVDADAFLGVGLVVNGSFGVLMALGVVAVGVGVRVVGYTGPEIAAIVATYHVEIAAMVLASTAYRTVREAIEGNKRVGRSGLLQGAERVTRSALQIGALLLGYGIAELIVGHVVAVTLATAVGFLLVGTDVSLPSRDQIRSVVEYARYAWLGTLRTRVYGWMDTVVLGFFVTTSLVGIYQAAWGIASLLGIVSVAIRRSLFPEVSELSTREDFERISTILDEGVLYSGIFVIPGLFGAAVMGDRILRFYRPAFGQGGGILVVLIAAYATDVYGSQFMNVINGVDRPDIAYRINAVFIAVNVTLNVALVWAFGWYGAAVATAFSSLVRTVLAYSSLRNTIDTVPLPVVDIGREVLAAALMAVAVLPVAPYVPEGRLWTLLLVGFGALVYFIALLALSRRVRNRSVGLASGLLA